MNCQNFTERTRDLARGALMDAGARAEALAHEKACAACAARLADERALSEGLRALAARDADLAAPPRVEAALLAAFRARRGAPAAADLSPATPAPRVVLNLAEAREFKRRTWAKTLATAATAAAAAASLLMIVAPHDAPPPQRAVRSEVAGERPVTTTPADATTNETSSVPGSPAATTTASVRGDDEPAPATGSGDDRNTPTARVARPGRAATTIQARYARNGSAGARGAAQAADTAAAEGEELATDFISLPQGAGDAAVVAGQLVRVELPRSALSRFGFQVSAERASERIKADVLLGEDGTARAIRFVR